MSEILTANLQNAARMVVSNTRRGRPRSKDAHSRIIASTLDLLAQKGFAGLTIETVARQAHVGKSTIYRHWKSKTELVVEAIDLEISTLGNDCNSGDLTKDLNQAFTNLSTLFSGRTGSALAKILGEAQSNPKLISIVRERWHANRDGALAAIIQRGEQAGQLRSGSNSELIAQLALGAMLFRTLIVGQPFSTLECDYLAKVILSGIAQAEPTL